MRDKRWENVFAVIRPYEQSAEEVERDERTGLTELYLEVVYQGYPCVVSRLANLKDFPSEDADRLKEWGFQFLIQDMDHILKERDSWPLYVPQV